jgi:hypothetical protein
MDWQIIVALIVGITIILFPVAFVWFINIGGIYRAMKEAKAKRAAHKKEVTKLVSDTTPVQKIIY